MSLRQRWTMVVLVLVAALGVLVWARWPQGRGLPKGSRPPAPATRAPAGATNSTADRPPPQTDARRSLLLRAAQDLKSSSGAESSRKIFADLRRTLAALPNEVASARIREALDSGADAPSRLGFTIGRDGFLKDPSSLRVFLLDYLGQVDPAAAAAYAERILGSLSSPDEWAVSLRNYARGTTNADARTFLQQKLREMMRHEPWQNDPSVGFLEAFDVAVHAGGTELLPDLSGLLRQNENKAVAHAAYLALDRLTIQDPVAVLAKLEAEPDLMAGREATRANYFARANVGDPQQRTILENYLLDPLRSEAELKAFVGLFPSGNFMVSQNLLTRVSTPSGDAITRQDREALQVVNGWLVDPRFDQLKPRLQDLKTRLENFVSQSGKGNK